MEIFCISLHERIVDSSFEVDFVEMAYYQVEAVGHVTKLTKDRQVIRVLFNLLFKTGVQLAPVLYWIVLRGPIFSS